MLNTSAVTVTCPVELEEALKRELDLLNIPPETSGRGFIMVQANLTQAYDLVLWSRIANRVLLPIIQVPLIDQEGFYESMKAVRWEEWCEASCSLSIQWAVTTEEHHGQYFMYRLKDAICDRFREKFDARPSVDTKSADISFHLLLTDKYATVYLDLAGGSLHRRGYRPEQNKHSKAQAPLKENLAAALLYLADWHTDQYSLLLDPLCGSGTLLLEAALMRAKRAPGLLACGRNGALPCPGWLGHDIKIWQQCVARAQQQAVALPAENKKIIFGLDGDKQAVQQALLGAALAGVSEWIHVERREVHQLAEWPRIDQLKNESGLIITNPPYGERLGDANAIPYLYQNLGSALQSSLPTWTLGLIAGSKQQAQAAGVKGHQIIYRQRVHNGPLGCDFSVSKFSAPSQAALIVLQLDGERYEKALAAINAAEDKDDLLPLFNRLRKNAKALQKWIKQDHVQCYRLYDADMPEFNAAIDIYGNRLHVQEYAPPKTIDENKSAKRFNLILRLLKLIFDDAKGIHTKTRRKQKGNLQYKKQAENQVFFEIGEDSAKILVNLDDYLDTGLFLDHRPIRLQIAQQSKGKRFLNLFCYTGVATMHAAVGGAKSSVSIDLSAAYIQWAKTNLALNGFNEANHRFIRADVMQWMERCTDQFDLIFIDPPTYSNSKKTDKDFDVQADHVSLIDMAMKRLEPGGQIIFSNNFRRFQLDEGLASRYAIKEITHSTIPPDFSIQKGKPIHRCWLIERQS